MIETFSPVSKSPSQQEPTRNQIPEIHFLYSSLRIPILRLAGKIFLWHPEWTPLVALLVDLVFGSNIYNWAESKYKKTDLWIFPDDFKKKRYVWVSQYFTIQPLNMHENIIFCIYDQVLLVYNFSYSILTNICKHINHITLKKCLN